MGISTQDEVRLQELQKFSTFFDFISNPKQYKDMLTRVEQTLKDMRAVVEAHATVTTANEYLRLAQAKVDETNAFVDESQKQLGLERGKMLQELLLVETRNQQRTAELDRYAAGLEDREQKLRILEADLAERLDKQTRAEQMLQDGRQEVAAQRADLEQRLAKLREAAL